MMEERKQLSVEIHESGCSKKYALFGIKLELLKVIFLVISQIFP
jgi:hypothetical protein